MQVVYDEVKNQRNIRERGLSFARSHDFDFVSAIQFEIFRNGELRKIAIGYLDDRLHMLCYTGGIFTLIRVISFRKVNLKEALRYGKQLRRTIR